MALASNGIRCARCNKEIPRVDNKDPDKHCEHMVNSELEVYIYG
jgi:hypothetical protein